MTEVAITQEQFTLLMEKMDRIESHMAQQQRRQQEMEELQRDLIPIGNHLFKLAIDELAEIGSEFQAEDLFFLLKRVLRDTNLLLKVFDQLENVMELSEDIQVLGKQIFNQGVQELDRLEREGYFAFAREGWQIVERVVTEFSEEDVRALADNVVVILKTVRNMTQPEIMAIANQSVDAIRETPDESKNISAFKLVKEMGSPQVKRGMSRMLNLLKAMGETPTE
ncbi:MAG: DUF1641 domain-containing protein [Anaerolineae bacterium]|jgi:uncharacterized protein YjgD (DUF1641 family)|nr:DUF1641 domain-containing protein [Anaerolineae bacterium]MBT7069327.1 DUF1641 domain-containing protein [Anaerolineae bacterium]MBT7325957.1 DUF1641 domain-containing protein [Anaerolineae bacterium]